jgi:hypothetical protein
MKMKALLLIPLLAVTLACPANSTQKLATASDAIAHGLVNADAAVNQAAVSGVVTPADRESFHGLLVKVSQAGQVLDQGIRANAAATPLSPKVHSFLDAFNALNTQGLDGIKDPNVKLAVSTILTGAETSVAIIAAAVGK